MEKESRRSNRLRFPAVKTFLTTEFRSMLVVDVYGFEVEQAIFKSKSMFLITKGFVKLFRMKMSDVKSERCFDDSISSLSS